MKNIVLRLAVVLLTLSVAGTALAQEKGQKLDMVVLQGTGISHTVRVVNAEPVSFGWLSPGQTINPGQTCRLNSGVEFEIAGFDQEGEQILLLVSSYPFNPYGLPRFISECPLGVLFFIPQKAYAEGVKKDKQDREDHFARQRAADEEARKVQDSVRRALSTDRPEKK